MRFLHVTDVYRRVFEVVNVFVQTTIVSLFFISGKRTAAGHFGRLLAAGCSSC